MRYHGIDIARADKESEPGSAEPFEILAAVEPRLTEHTDRISLRFEHARDYRRAERRMVDVSVAADVNEIDFASGFFFCYGQKRHDALSLR
jgi:hypothetical protein